jgi:hypothetical protein
MEESLAEAQSRMEKAEQLYARVKEQSEEQLEIAEALGARKLEVWPMLPNKKILRVLGSEEFDGRVSSEFRVKDEESLERGVSLLMGRCSATHTHEVQCVLFDPKHMSDLQAARWWAANCCRFQKAEARRRRPALAPASHSLLPRPSPARLHPPGPPLPPPQARIAAFSAMGRKEFRPPAKKRPPSGATKHAVPEDRLPLSPNAIRRSVPAPSPIRA